MLVALLALFVALGGTGYAVSKLPRNSVGNKQLRSKAVTAAKIRSGAVTRAKIRKGAIVASDVVGLAPSAVRLAGSSSSSKSSPPGLHTFNATMSRGDAPKTVASLGPFTLVGSCEPNSGKVLATLEAHTTAASSYFQSDPLTDRDWQPSETRTVVSLLADTGSRTEDSSQLKMFNTATGDYTYMGDGETVGVLVGFQGADCRFIGSVVLFS